MKWNELLTDQNSEWCQITFGMMSLGPAGLGEIKTSGRSRSKELSGVDWFVMWVPLSEWIANVQCKDRGTGCRDVERAENFSLVGRVRLGTRSVRRFSALKVKDQNHDCLMLLVNESWAFVFCPRVAGYYSTFNVYSLEGNIMVSNSQARFCIQR